ncbi:MAG: polysulfide reductase NrfD [Deltaproteobacteria bacterium]|nr:polysulfide reductase NrfD [Deltaproteobacteria bacterium]
MMHNRSALTWLKDGLWALFLAGMVVGVGRFVFGLGAATNMMDLLPWGFWKVFNMVAGAALATSGFVVAAIIYIFQLDKFRPVARFSILVGFLGYGTSLMALLFDIGLPHRGWHPFFMWNPHSFLFEVFWCVSIYWSITAFELLPIITERFPFPKVTHFINEIMLPFVILGVTLSTMHHSSLGSLFMLSPTRLYPLWYSLWIPPEFFISAMGAGLSVITLLMMGISKLYKRKRNMGVLTALVKGSAAFLALYLIIKVADFTVNEKWNFVFGPDITWETYLFWVEISLQAIIPIVVFVTPVLRNSKWGLLAGTLSAAAGIIMHRLNTGIVGYFRTAETIYIPNISELLLSFGILAGAGLLFLLLVERFYVFDEPEEHADGHGSDATIWTREEALAVFAGPRAKRMLLIALVVIPLSIGLLRDQATGPFKPISQPIANSVIGVDVMRTTLRIDGNRNGEYVDFTHDKHQLALMKDQSLKKEETCQECHHLNLPQDNNTNCRSCHADLDLDTGMFKPENHKGRFESAAAFEQFMELDLTDGQKNLEACQNCHKDNMRGLTTYADKGFSHMAPGFKDAMHGSCQTCHRQRETDPTNPVSDGNCLFCHKTENFPAMEVARQ